jgi:hypothetical protein
MIHLQKLAGACGADSAELDYATEVVRRLVGIFGSHLTFDQSIALIHVLQLYSFIYDDGFIINDYRGNAELIGPSEAASIVSAFWEEPEKDWEWWRQASWSYDKSTPTYQALFDAIVAKICATPGVREHEPGSA